MKFLNLAMMLLCAASLSACSDSPSSSDSPAEVRAEAEKMEAKAAKALENKDAGAVIDYLNNEAKVMTKIMTSVTDGPSAEAAIPDFRESAPRLKAAMDAFEFQDMTDLDLSSDAMTKMPIWLETQAEMINEMRRVNEIEAARDVLQAEFDKMGF